MDCQTVLSKVKTMKYTNVKEMIDDVRQMFKNCSIYNEDSSEIFKMGKFMKVYIIWIIVGTIYLVSKQILNS